MRKTPSVFLLGVFLSCLVPSLAQQQQHFYNIDKEIHIKGSIKDIIMEPRYKNSSPFLVVVLEDKENQKIYNIEVSPIWFFENDFHKGEDLHVTGSPYTTAENEQNVIAREVRFRGETLVLRDKHGFPTWRGQGKGKGRKRGKNF